MTATEDVLASLLQASRSAGADELVPLVARHAEAFGAVSTTVLVADLQQSSLGPVQSEGERVRIEGSLPGRVFTGGQALWSGDDLPVFWIPLLDGAERLGAIGFGVTERSAEFEERTRLLASLVAGLLVSKELYGDRIVQAKRTREMSVAAEMQWALLPPRTFGTSRVLVSGTLEPAYDIGGDTFDYALNGDILHVAVLDAMGRGLRAATLAAVAVAAYRQARRSGLDLRQTVASMDSVIAAQFRGDGFVTGWVGELDLRSGTLRFVNAGHPLARLLRDGKVVKSLDAPPVLPFGLTQDRIVVAEEGLEPGTRSWSSPMAWSRAAARVRASSARSGSSSTSSTKPRADTSRRRSCGG